MKKLAIAAVMVAGLAAPASALTIPDFFTSYYAFGDSLTDGGKLGALGAPSLGGRFSNGRTYAEYLADRFTGAGLDTGNLALGGATAGDVNPAAFTPLSTLSGQIATFTGALASGFGLPTKLGPPPQFQPAGPTPGSNPLVSILFGGNDFFQGQDMVAAADAVANGIRAIGSIASHTFDDFLVLSLPDISGTPAFAGSAVAKAASDAFNAQLALNILDLRGEGFNIITFDTDSVTDEILTDFANGSPLYGVTDVTTPCTLSMAAPGPSCVDLGLDPDTFLYSDAVHPNGVSQRLLGERVIATLEAVPLPAAMPLMLVAIAGLGLAARHRRAA